MLPHTASLAFDSGTLSCDADVLTREASRHHVNTASPWAAVEGLNVIPDRERFEASVVLSGDQNVPCVGVPFDGADGAPSKQFAAKNAASSACE
ncbi:MAG: hypothetical protein QM680_13500 [Luteolibacter sp.]